MARPKDDWFELVSGHRRKAVAEILGLEKLPVLVREMTDDEATLLMVDSNIQRKNLLPSEKAFSYKLKLEAMKRKAGRPSGENCSQVGNNKENKRSVQIFAEDIGESKNQIFRYIRLTELVKPVLDLVDSKRIAFSPAVELSYLTKDEQAELWDIINQEDCTPSLSQAVRMKKLSQELKLTPEVIYAIITEEQANQKEQQCIGTCKIKKLFPKSFTLADIEQEIIKLLEERTHKQIECDER